MTELQQTWDILTWPYTQLPTVAVDTDSHEGPLLRHAQPLVRWFAMDRKSHHNIGGVAWNVEHLDEAIRALNPRGFDMYAHLNPTHPVLRTRATIGDTLAWAFLLVDIDPLGKQTLNGRLLDNPVPAAAPLGSPTVVYTGRGFHLWYRLHPSAPPWWKVGEAQRSFLRSLVPPGDCRIDPLGDTARIVRLPGTINHRTGEKARLVSQGGISSPEASDYLLGFGREVERRGVEATEHTLEWQDVKDSLTVRARTFLDLGADAGVRHETCWHVARLLFERGVTKASALAGLRWGNDASREKLADRELQEIIKQVYL